MTIGSTIEVGSQRQEPWRLPQVKANQAEGGFSATKWFSSPRAGQKPLGGFGSCTDRDSSVRLDWLQGRLDRLLNNGSMGRINIEHDTVINELAAKVAAGTVHEGDFRIANDAKVPNPRLVVNMAKRMKRRFDSLCDMPSQRFGTHMDRLACIEVARYTVFLYVWEDNQPEIYNVSVNDQEVLKGYNSRREGHWDKLGPWVTDSKNGQIVLTTTGGTANLSGIEIWLGEYDGANIAPIPDEQQAFFETKIRPLCGPPNSVERPPKKGTTGGGIMVLAFQSGWPAEASKEGLFAARLTRSAKRSPVTQSTCTTCTRRSRIKWGSITRG